VLVAAMIIAVVSVGATGAVSAESTTDYTQEDGDVVYSSYTTYTQGTAVFIDGEASPNTTYVVVIDSEVRSEIMSDADGDLLVDSSDYPTGTIGVREKGEPGYLATFSVQKPQYDEIDADVTVTDQEQVDANSEVYMPEVGQPGVEYSVVLDSEVQTTVVADAEGDLLFDTDGFGTGLVGVRPVGDAGYVESFSLVSASNSDDSNSGSSDNSTENESDSGSSTLEDINVSVSPQEETVQNGSETTFEIFIGNGSQEVTAVDFQVIVSGEVSDNVETSAETGGNFGVSKTTTLSPLTGQRVMAVGSATTDLDTNAVATFSVNASETGNATVGIGPATVGDENNGEYDVVRNNSSLVVVDSPARPPSVGDEYAQPTNIDSDSQFEDINGDGSFTILDVSIFLKQFETSVVTDNSAAFDFNGDGSISIVDVAQLLEEL
jgi:hypothetical protein